MSIAMLKDQCIPSRLWKGLSFTTTTTTLLIIDAVCDKHTVTLVGRDSQVSPEQACMHIVVRQKPILLQIGTKTVNSKNTDGKSPAS